MALKTLSCEVGRVVQQSTHWAPKPPPKQGSGQGKRKQVEVPQGRKWPENTIQLLCGCLFTALRTVGNAGNQNQIVDLDLVFQSVLHLATAQAALVV